LRRKRDRHAPPVDAARATPMPLAPPRRAPPPPPLRHLTFNNNNSCSSNSSRPTLTTNNNNNNNSNINNILHMAVFILNRPMLVNGAPVLGRPRLRQCNHNIDINTNSMNFPLFIINFLAFLLLSLHVSIVQSVECIETDSPSHQCERPFTAGVKDMQYCEIFLILYLKLFIMNIDYLLFSTDRVGYPGKPDNKLKNDNYLFYSDQLPSRPDNMKISQMLKNKTEGGLFGDYDLLER
jgi:hypothetical protein